MLQLVDLSLYWQTAEVEVRTRLRMELFDAASKVLDLLYRLVLIMLELLVEKGCLVIREGQWRIYFGNFVLRRNWLPFKSTTNALHACHRAFAHLLMATIKLWYDLVVLRLSFNGSLSTRTSLSLHILDAALILLPHDIYRILFAEEVEIFWLFILLVHEQGRKLNLVTFVLSPEMGIFVLSTCLTRVAELSVQGSLVRHPCVRLNRCISLLRPLDGSLQSVFELGFHLVYNRWQTLDSHYWCHLLIEF